MEGHITGSVDMQRINQEKLIDLMERANELCKAEFERVKKENGGEATLTNQVIESHNGRLGKIEGVTFSRRYGFMYLVMIYYIGSKTTMNTEAWTRSYRRMNELKFK